MDQLPWLGKRELICLLLFTCNYVVFVWRGFLFLWVLGMGYVILLWHSLSLPYNYFGVGVHQGSVLSPLLFIIVLEALSREFRTGCPWELLYADDLMISAGSKEELLVKVKTWKIEMEKKGLRVNMGKTKIMESGIKRELICLLLFTCNYVVSVWRGFLFLWVLGMGYIVLLWHSLSLPYNY